MLSSIRNIFLVKDLRNKVLFTLLMISIYQLGANVPVPGVSFSRIRAISQANKGSGILGFLNLFSGGALARAAVLGLGIMPYITSSIIVQLLGTVIPKFAEWREQGAVGQRKLTQATRYLTIALALMQASGIVFLLHSGQLFSSSSSSSSTDLIPNFSAPHVLFIILTFTAGTAFVMWLGENITQRGIGQGMSILIFSNVVATLPFDISIIRADKGIGAVFIILLVWMALLVAIVAVELGQRRIPVTFARRVQGRRMYGGQSTYIPLKVNQAGVIPIIFASSLLYIPVLISSILPWAGVHNWVTNNLLSPTGGVYLVLYGLFIVVFTFFYVQVSFDPFQQADTIRKQGGYIPGIRPGPPTEQYLAHILNRITLPGALFLASVALVPSAILAAWHIVGIPFFGTTLLISVGVALETNKQIDSQLTMRNYEGFLH